MADVSYDVVYLARSPASMPGDEFATMVDEACNGRAAGGWRLVSAVGDYGAKVTLGVWLYFASEAGSPAETPPAKAAADDDVRSALGLEEDDGGSAEPPGIEEADESDE